MPSRFTATEAEVGALSLSGPFPGGREQGALCVERPFLTSSMMELRVPQIRRLPSCIFRVRTTHKFLALCEGLGHPRPLIFARAIGAKQAHSPSARSSGICVIWFCISPSSSCKGKYRGALGDGLLRAVTFLTLSVYTELTRISSTESLEVPSWTHAAKRWCKRPSIS
jgi:hypothetical protein